MTSHAVVGPRSIHEKSELAIHLTPSCTDLEASQDDTSKMTTTKPEHHHEEATLSTATGVPLTRAISALSLTRTATGTYDDDDFPDGGWAAWSCVFGAWCAFICTFGIFNCAGIFVQIYHDDILKDSSLALIAWIPALQGFAMDSSTAVVSYLSCFSFLLGLHESLIFLLLIF